jgi:hypothetical protein
MHFSQEHPKSNPCTQAIHRRYTVNPESFNARTRFLGHQSAFLDAPPLVLGTCLDCGSTLSRELTPAEFAKLELANGGRS